jgi:hypothetical protein
MTASAQYQKVAFINAVGSLEKRAYRYELTPKLLDESIRIVLSDAEHLKYNIIAPYFYLHSCSSLLIDDCYFVRLDLEYFCYTI